MCQHTVCGKGDSCCRVANTQRSTSAIIHSNRGEKTFLKNPESAVVQQIFTILIFEAVNVNKANNFLN